MALAIIFGFFVFIIAEALSPLSGIHMLAYVFVGGIFAWVMWVLREKEMAVMGLASTALCVLYTLLDVLEPMSNLIKKVIGG